MFRSSNPALNGKMFSKSRSFGVGESMTIQGTVNKCFIMFALILVSASWVWVRAMQPVGPFETEQAVARSVAAIMPIARLGGILGLVLVIVTMFNLSFARYTAPLYAVCEGLFIGGTSAIFEIYYPGIVIQAVGLTLGTLFCLLTAYKSGMIHVNQKFKRIVYSAFGAIFLIYIVGFFMSFFGATIPYIHESGPVGIGFSLVVVGIASALLVIDFDRIQAYASQGLPKYMEWYGALSLMITLIWLYIEVLILLSKLRGGRR